MERDVFARDARSNIKRKLWFCIPLRAERRGVRNSATCNIVRIPFGTRWYSYRQIPWKFHGRFATYESIPVADGAFFSFFLSPFLLPLFFTPRRYFAIYLRDGWETAKFIIRHGNVERRGLINRIGPVSFALSRSLREFKLLPAHGCARYHLLSAGGQKTVYQLEKKKESKKQ